MQNSRGTATEGDRSNSCTSLQLVWLNVNQNYLCNSWRKTAEEKQLESMRKIYWSLLGHHACRELQEEEKII